MTITPQELIKPLLDAAISVKTVRAEIELQGEFFKRNGLELPPELVVIDRLAQALATVFEYAAAHGGTFERSIEAMGRDMAAELEKLNAMMERIKQTIIN